MSNICDRCGKEFKTKTTLNLHYKRKSPCVKKEKILDDKKNHSEVQEINTFKDLYNFLKVYNSNEILSWLDSPWVGKDKQESLLRLFAGLGLIGKLSNFWICKGNFNLQTISKIKEFQEIFYDDKGKEIYLKDKGDSSDLTGISKSDQKLILATTSKNLSTENIGKMDIEKILFNFKEYSKNGYHLSLCFVVRDSENFQKVISGIQRTNKNLSDFLKDNQYFIIDWSDLNRAYSSFKQIYTDIQLQELCKSEKIPFIPKLHQIKDAKKTLRLKSEGKEKCLWGHIQRSGKSYILAETIYLDSRVKDSGNYLIITTAPNETIDQYIKVLDCLQLSKFNIIYLHGKTGKPSLTKNNIIICSKQFLQSKLSNNKEKTNVIPWLKDINFDIRFVDESHNGGTTSLAQKTLEFYGNDAFTVMITATYSKPVFNYNIPKDSWIIWDLEDISLCKRINEGDNKKKLIDKHAPEMEEIIFSFSDKEIVEEYSKYPELFLLTDKLDSEVEKEIVELTRDNSYGWSTEACFLLKEDEKEVFQNPDENLKIWYRIFGKRGKYNIPDKDYPDDKVFIKRIERLCKNPQTSSRFFEDDQVMVVMAFLPMKEIDKISTATKNLLESKNVIPDFEIISINSNISNDPKGLIEEGRKRAAVNGKKGLLVLSGRQCSLGVSIHNCDIVLLLNNNTSFDMIYQMMFRSMTEGEGKKCGFVVDLNIKRAIDITFEYSMQMKPDLHPKEAIKYVLEQRLINLNSDHWIGSEKNLENFSSKLYHLYTANTEKIIKIFLDRLRYKQLLLTKDENLIFKTIFQNKPLTKTQKEAIDKMLKDVDLDKIKDGIERLKIEDEKEEEEEKDDEKEEKINYMEILKHIIPLICLLTIHQDQTSFEEMFLAIENDQILFHILIDQTRSWWGDKIDKRLVKKFILIYTKYLKDDKEVKSIVRTVKELFKKNLENSGELSKLIDDYFIPQKLEKDENAEVSTPNKLRKEMLDCLPLDFWSTPKKVFEPCSGKGGFLLDIIDKFNEGLKESYPDPDERYRVIVEECIYFADINPTNIFICKLLLDPYNNYQLNYLEGDTLEMNFEEEWGFKSFDAIIGNPPYSTNPSRQDSKPLYNLFIEYLIDKTYYLLFVVPSRWFVGGKGLDKFRKKMMSRKDIRTIVHTDDAKIWFGKIVAIMGGCNYFLKDKGYKGPCKFVCLGDEKSENDYPLNKYDTIIKTKYHPIIDKISKFESITEIYKGRCFGVETNDKRLRDKDNVDSGKAVKCFISFLKSKDRLKYLEKYTFTEDNTFWKVITSRASGTGFGCKFIGKPDEIHTGSYISFKVDNEEEAKSLLSYLECKLPNYMLTVRKISQDINENVLKWVPLVPLDRIWDDKQVFEYFQIKPEELI